MGGDLRRRLRELLDIKDDSILAALYSDPIVREISERLIRRWEEAGRQGDPLDYASDDEARRLLRVAQRYIYMSPEEARRLAFGRIYSGAAEDTPREGFISRLRRILKAREGKG